MASARGPRYQLFTGLALASVATMTLAGCPAVPGPSSASDIPNIRVNKNGDSGVTSIAQTIGLQYIDGTLTAPAALGSGGKIVGDEELGDITLDIDDNATEAEDATEAAGATEAADATESATATESASGTAAYRVLQSSPAELPVENAFVTVKSFEFKIIDQFLTKQTDDEGKFYFERVPIKTAFFLEAQFSKGGKRHQLFGLTRTGEFGARTALTMDVASTLTARVMMRMWQQGNFFFDFEKVSPKDYMPLLLNLRNVLRGGLPAGVTLDLTKVSLPVEQWDDKATPLVDADDSAVVALDKIAAQYSQIDRDIDRLYKAVNLAWGGSETGIIVRPAKIK